MRRLRQIATCLFVVSVLIGSVFATPASASSVSRTMRCTAVYNHPTNGSQIIADVSITIRGAYNASRTRITFTTTAWAYTNARRVATTSTTAMPIDTKNNLNLVSPLAWNSPDTLGASGSYNTPDFSVARGATVRVQGIPDVRNHPDPKCTASATVNW